MSQITRESEARLPSQQAESQEAPAEAALGTGLLGPVSWRALANAAPLLLVILLFAAAALGWAQEPWQSAAILVIVVAAVAGLWWTRLRPSAAAAVDRDAMLALSVQSGAQGVLIVDGRGRMLYANPAYRDLVGAPADRPAPAQVPTLAALFQADSPERARLAALAAAAREAEGETRQETLALPGRPGAARWLSVGARRLAAGDDRLAWHVEDATPARVADDALRAARARLAAFVDGAPVGYCLVDRAGRIDFANPTLAAWCGRESADLTRQEFELDQLIDWDGPAPAFAGAAGFGAAARLKRADGELLPVRLDLRPAPVDGGKPERRPERWAVTILDTAREAELDTLLKKTAREFHQIFDMAPGGVVTLDQAGVVSQANRAFARMSGTEDGGVGRDWAELLHAEDRAEVADYLARAAEGAGQAPPIEVRLGAAHDRVGQLFATPLQDEAEGRQLLLHLIDTTEQKDLELRFFQSQKMQAVGQLAGGVAHDFNNLLTAMIGFCDLLLLHHPAGDPSFSDIMHIKQNANRAANLVRQLLAFSRQQTLRPKVLVLTDVLAELSNLVRRLIGENIELQIVHARDLAPVKVDQGQFEQVVINLAVNARDAMTDGGTLTINTSNVTITDPKLLGHDMMTPGDYVLIEVVDTGHGIPKENIGKIYEPFFTTKEVGAGTGLGLSTVYGIIKQTGGYIWVVSEIDRGTTFQIYLPQYVPTEDEVRAADAQEAQVAVDLTGKGTILLVEDEDAVRMFAARALKNKGYTVLEAESGEGALETIRGHDGIIDLLVSDVVMPNMDGPTLVRHARVERPEMRIIFISGYAEDAFRKNLDRDAQEIEFLPKPFSLKQLAAKVKDVLAA